MGFFEILRGYEDKIAREFAMALYSQVYVIATTMVRGLAITITPELISRITTLPLGIKWNR